MFWSNSWWVWLKRSAGKNIVKRHCCFFLIIHDLPPTDLLADSQ